LDPSDYEYWSDIRCLSLEEQEKAREAKDETVKVIAFFLPQFHPIPENDTWWNPGFTEWTNVARARPLFPGHQQPRIPGELGFYDLRLPETREQQAALAKEYGIYGFCYYHYWFAGKLLLERPLEDMLKTGRPDINFCLCWANESWTANWVGRPDKILIAQTYPGESDHRAHIEYLSPFFKDPRYIKVDGCPLFLIHRPFDIPRAVETLALWRRLAEEHIGSDLFIVGVGNEIEELLALGFDGVTTHSLTAALREYLTGIRRVRQFFMHRILRWPRWVIPYRSLVPYLIRKEWSHSQVFPDVLPNWDHSPRLGRRALVITDSKPQLFMQVVKRAVEAVKDRPGDHQLVFLRSWNEWAEGNYVEPDLIHGRAFLEAIAAVVKGSACAGDCI